MVSQDGYTLALTEARAPAGEDRPLSFSITGPVSPDKVKRPSAPTSPLGSPLITPSRR